MVEPIYLSESTKSRYLRRRSTEAFRWPTPTGLDGSEALRAVMLFSAEYAAAMVSFHASLLKGALSPWLSLLRKPGNE